MRWWILAGALAIVSACGPIRDDGVVKSLEATLTVTSDGSLGVEERFQVSLPSGATSFRRRADVWRHDGVQAVTGEIDGSGSRLDVGSGPALDATWQFAQLPAGEHTFVLRYRLAGVVETSGIRGTVAWRFQNPYQDIPDARFRLQLPPGAIFLEDPWVEEAGFEVARLDHGMSARGAVRRGATGTPGATFTIDTMTAEEPAWQYHQRRARDLIPAFISGGLFLFVIGAGVLGMLRLKYPPWRIREGAHVDAPSLSTEVRAALALDRYPKHLRPGMIESGLIDIERMNAARDLARAAIATLVLGVITWIVADRWFGHLGLGPLAIPIGILVSAGMFWFGARRMPILSERGVLARNHVLYSARVRDGQTTA